MLPCSSVVSCFDPLSLLSFFPTISVPIPLCLLHLLGLFCVGVLYRTEGKHLGTLLDYLPCLNTQQLASGVLSLCRQIQGECGSCAGKHLQPWNPFYRSVSLSLSQTFYKPIELRLFSEQWKMCFFLAFAYFAVRKRMTDYCISGLIFVILRGQCCIIYSVFY